MYRHFPRGQIYHAPSPITSSVEWLNGSHMVMRWSVQYVASEMMKSKHTLFFLKLDRWVEWLSHTAAYAFFVHSKEVHEIYLRACSGNRRPLRIWNQCQWLVERWARESFYFSAFCCSCTMHVMSLQVITVQVRSFKFNAGLSEML